MVFDRCVPEWNSDPFDLYIFTGWNLDDLHELHMFRREDQISLRNLLGDERHSINTLLILSYAQGQPRMLSQSFFGGCSLDVFVGGQHGSQLCHQA